MGLVDGAVILVMVAGFIHGMIKGAILEVSAAAAIVIGVFGAGKIATASMTVTSRLAHPTAGKVFAFVLSFIVIAVVVSLLGKAVSNVVKKSALSSVDRFVGGLIGACIVGLVVGLVFKLMAIAGLENQAVAQSELVRKLMAAVSGLAGFLAGGSEEVVASILMWCGLAGRR
jgi:uncharacterized membrane protein required for colicin V production